MLASYYVDSVGGNDGNLGNSPNEAWQSLNHLFGIQLTAGDQVFLRRGSVWDESLTVDDPGTAAEPIVVTSFGEGAAPIIQGLSVYADNVVIEEIVVDRGKNSGDAVRIRNAHDVILRNMEVRNGISDGIDGTDVDRLLIDGLTIHHFLAGSFTNQQDAHGVVFSETQGLTIRNTEIHHVSGDSFQADPNRDPATTTDIVIEQCHFWTSPLTEDFNDFWFAGERPGENAIDTKVASTNWETAERMQITLRDVVAHGWVRDGFIANKAVFNMKEKVEAVFDGVTVFDSEIAFRLRGTRGNANVTLKNAVIYDVEKAIRAEDNLSNLKVFNTTFGDQILQTLQFAGGSGGVDSWDWRNNAFFQATIPSVAASSDNRVATAGDFVSVSTNDYHLSDTSTLLDVGVDLTGQVAIDRDGTPRSQGDGYDIGAFERVPSSTAAPRVESVSINKGAFQRSIVDAIDVTFDSVVTVDESQNDVLQIRNTGTNEFAAYELSQSVESNKTVISIQFLAGPTVDTRSGATKSLADGNYQMIINASRIEIAGMTLDGNADGVAGDDYVFGDEIGDRFFRFSGDSDGDRDVDVQDYGQFAQSFLQPPTSKTYDTSFDFDGGNDIDGRDLAMLEANFLKKLPN
ncbi:MAG: right-handed parallel beta-helix repeat-containing protein [Planctomycetales bacterium]|nr:right-handed parallel beta-helix repeat-containing protein [Planctomycetales bacterium]